MSEDSYHHGNLPTLLVEQARAIVESEGPAAVSIAKVAAACGVSVAAPYRHFRNKAQLLAAVANEGFMALGAAFDAARGADSPRERLIAVGVAYVRFAETHQGMFRLMFSLEERESHPQGGPAALAALRGVLEPLDLRVPLDVAVRTSWALVHGEASLRVSGMRTYATTSEEDLRADLAALVTGLT